MKKSYKRTMYACYLGYITQAITNNLAPLFFVIFQNDYDISFEMIGRLILVNFGTQILVDYLAIRYVDKIGYRVAAVIAHGFSVVGLILLGVLPQVVSVPYVGITIAVMIYAIGGGLIEVLISPIVDSLPGEAKASSMSLLHSFYCWGQVAVVAISTLFLKLIGTEYWYILPVVWTVLPLCNMIIFTKVPLLPTVSEEERIPLKKLFGSKLFVLAIVLMICAGASEQAMSQWSSLFAEKGLQVPKVIGDLLGPCLFAVFMGIGRTIYGIKGEQINLRMALKGCSVLCIICYVTTVFAPNPVIALMGCAVTGLSVSLMWPGLFSLSAESFRNGGTAMFGVLAIAGDIGCAAGPWLTGIISDTSQKIPAIVKLSVKNGQDLEQVGLKVGLLIAMVFPLILLIGVGRMKGMSE